MKLLDDGTTVVDDENGNENADVLSASGLSCSILLELSVSTLFQGKLLEK